MLDPAVIIENIKNRFGFFFGEENNITNSYILKEVIGQGSFGIVRKCQHRKTKKLFACKTIAKSKVPSLELLKREVDHLKTVHHPYIVELEDVYDDDKCMHLVTELITGGELYDRVIQYAKSPQKHFPEADAATVIRNILDAISYCHDVQHIVHRDLKASNFLFLDPNTNTHVKIIDFGLSIYVPRKSLSQSTVDGIKIIQENNKTKKDDDTNGEPGTETEMRLGSPHRDSHLGVMRSRVGTPYYVAPEVLTQDTYTNQCDVWSIGVISYLILSGTLPFQGLDERQTVKMLMKEDFQVEFPDEDWMDIPKLAQNFCRSLLNKNPEERPTAREAMGHEWIVQHCGNPPPLEPANHWKDYHIKHEAGTMDDSRPLGEEVDQSQLRSRLYHVFSKSKSSIA